MTTVEISRTSLLQRIGQASRGQWIMYHVGWLMEDRTKNRRLHATASEVIVQFELGTVCPVQRRLGDQKYEYYVVKR